VPPCCVCGLSGRTQTSAFWDSDLRILLLINSVGICQVDFEFTATYGVCGGLRESVLASVALLDAADSRSDGHPAPSVHDPGPQAGSALAPRSRARLLARPCRRVRVLCLKPIARAARHIAGAQPLGNNTLAPGNAGAFEDHLAVANSRCVHNPNAEIASRASNMSGNRLGRRCA
jgi:hypothetical protein